MTDSDLKKLKTWFAEYAESFYSADDEDQRNIMLKVEHTRNVCSNIVKIADGLGLDDNMKRLAETVALFHDVGRFSQYSEFRTFKDAESVNHGQLGAKVLAEEHILQNMPDYEQQLVIHTVKFHNAFAIPNTDDADRILLLKLIRDADKVDIYRVFIEYYESPADERASATAFGLPDTPEYSKEMLSNFYVEKVASYNHLKTENDFKLMKLSWVYDINFKPALDLIVERDYLNNIISKLPRTEDIKAAAVHLNKYVAGKMKNE